MSVSRTTRATALTACLGALLALIHTDTSVAPVAVSDGDPARMLTQFVSALRPDGAYRDPSAGERRQARIGIDLLLKGAAKLDRATTVLAELGFSKTTSTDPVTGRPYAMFTSEQRSDRAWGVLLVDLSTPVRLAIEVPHPNSDLRTEQLGLQLFRRLPGAIMLVAGAHRKASNEDADVAHNKNSLFHAAATQLARRKRPQLQLHGFAQQSLPDADVVVSAGTARPSAAVRRLAEQFERIGLVTCRAWQQRCGRLEGTTNVQAEDARARQSVFIHLEISWAVRGDRSRHESMVEALAAAELAAA